MRRNVQRVLALVFAVGLIVTAAGGAVQTGMVEREQVDPVGESRAIACGGVCIAGVAGATAIAAGTAGAAIGSYLSDNEVNETALAEADAQETKVSLYSTATTQHQNNRVLTDSYRNFLQDTPEIARMEGKNAYIRALESGASEVEARNQAKQAVADYYSQKQTQLSRQWDVSWETYATVNKTAKEDPNIDWRNVVDLTWGGAKSKARKVSMWTNESVTLANGSTIQTTGIPTELKEGTSFNRFTATPASANEMDSIAVKIDALGPNDNLKDDTFINYTAYWEIWAEIDSQNSQIQSDMDTYIDNTYSSYQEGDINSSDLVDPYLAAREYSPEGDYGTWTLRSMTSMGLNPPDNISSVGTMEVRDLETGTSYTGVLLSDGLPSSGEFAVGQTYNASTLAGPQYVMDREEGSTNRLSGEFRLENVTTMDGENTSTVGYRDVRYQTTDIQEFKQQQQELRETQAEIEARQQKLRNPSGGGGFLGGSANPTAVVLVVAVVALAVMFGRNER